MQIDEQGYVKHPDRYPEKGEQGFVVFSAAGFPDIDHNFEGLQGMFRNWDSHNEHTRLMGEFYLPAAELLAQPVYEGRKKVVTAACYRAGRTVVEKGVIPVEEMQKVSFPHVTRTRFEKQANTFWETLDNKAAYLKAVPKLAV